MQSARLSSGELDQLAKTIVDSALTVHKELGPGLLESVYHHCLIEELSLRNVYASSHVTLPLVYKGAFLNKDFVVDVLVEEEIILELKSVETLLPVHEAQILSYLKLADRRLGFLINFHVPLLKQGIKRFVNKF